MDMMMMMTYGGLYKVKEEAVCRNTKHNTRNAVAFWLENI
jgi:hypothetical protein